MRAAGGGTRWRARRRTAGTTLSLSLSLSLSLTLTLSLSLTLTPTLTLAVSRQKAITTEITGVSWAALLKVLRIRKRYLQLHRLGRYRVEGRTLALALALTLALA